MVSDKKIYPSQNSLAVSEAVNRNEFFYQLRLYSQSAPFMTKEACLQRMGVILGLIETKSLVLDAIMKVEDELSYLSVLCSSMASPIIFSKIINHISPKAIIEEISIQSNMLSLPVKSYKAPEATIPFKKQVHAFIESKKTLLSLLIEYRALMAEYNFSNSLHNSAPIIQSLNNDYIVPFVFFEINGQKIGLPEFNIKSILPGANKAFVVEVGTNFGKRILSVDDILITQSISIPHCNFINKVKRGMYNIEYIHNEEKDFFIFLVPSFL